MQLKKTMMLFFIFTLISCNESENSMQENTEINTEEIESSEEETNESIDIAMNTSGDFYIVENNILTDIMPSNITPNNLLIAGSSTVYPLAEVVVENFQKEGFIGQITLDSIGSGAGFERFLNDEIQIANASREIKDIEAEKAEKKGMEMLEFSVGIDALAIVVNKENDWLESLTLEELKQVFTQEKWSDINPDFPDKEITKYIPGTDSGTFDYFVEEIFDKDAEPLLSSSSIQKSEDDNILVKGIEGDKYSIGFFGFAYYKENKDQLKAISIEGIEANEKNVAEKAYPLSRYLHIYTNKKIFQNNPQVSGYIGYFLMIVNDIIGQVGYFPLTEKELQNNRAKWVQNM